MPRPRSIVLVAVAAITASTAALWQGTEAPHRNALATGKVVEAPTTQPLSTTLVMRATGVARLIAVHRPPQPDAVTDGDGNILFRSDRDHPSESTCFDACAIDWPPVLTSGPPQVTGIDPGLVGTLRRPDGTLQVTLGGWPLYRQIGTGTPGVVPARYAPTPPS
jgi:predicted lipoprotein with Yx(FWY)xxD motif